MLVAPEILIIPLVGGLSFKLVGVCRSTVSKTASCFQQVWRQAKAVHIYPAPIESDQLPFLRFRILEQLCSQDIGFLKLLSHSL